MTVFRSAVVALALGMATAAVAGAPVGPRYGDTLLASVKVKGVAGLRIDAKDKKGGAIEVVSGSKRAGTTVPLTDAMGTPIGTVSVVAAKGAHPDAAALSKWLSRRILVADNLVEADPFLGGVKRSRLGQAIVEQLIDANPDLVSIGLHVGPKGRENVMLATNFGRIGKLGDKDDKHVIDDEAIVREVTNGGRRLAVALPLHDKAGRTIGALSTSFLVPVGADPQSVASRGIAVRDAMAAKIPSLAALTAR